MSGEAPGLYIARNALFSLSGGVSTGVFIL